MRLEQIILHGFKSFAEKTEVRVLPGITCIVGPNGCGKSNVADAVRWALGEQSPKTLRGQKMEDVIFHGTASRKSTGLAEVGLLFGNDGSLGVPWSEVAVARRLYRTGESEYLLNRSACRLRDIQDLFAGTGVNPKAYALMDQERLNHVLTAKPWERRVFIEEAAGIARYKQQRSETQGKLDATRQNLQRVRDVMDEVRRQLGSLERQARKAQQYKALHAEKQALGLAMLAADFAALSARHDTLTREMERLRFEQDERTVQHAGLTSRQALQSATIQETEFRLADLRQLVQKMQGEAERLIERREQLLVQIREADEEDGRLGGEIRAIGERRVALSVEHDDKVRALGDGRERHADWLARLADLEERVEAARREVEERRARLDALRLEQVGAAGRRAELTREDGELRERRLNHERALARLAAESAQAEAEADAVAARRLRVEERRRAAGQQLSLLETERRQVLGQREESEAERARLQVCLGELRLGLAAKESQLEALQQLEREREGYGAGVRAVFSANGILHGVVGTVADLLEVPSGLEAAVEGVLGERLQWIVVERFEHARAALGYLEREATGPATFLPLETLPGGPNPYEDSVDVRWASRLVGGPRPDLLRYLLGRVGVVEHLDQAERLWRRNGVVATYVTPGGEVLTPTGRLSGGRRDGDREAQDHSILRRKRAIRSLGEEVAAAGAEVERERARLEALDGVLADLRVRESALTSSVQTREAERLTGDKDLEAAERETERLERYLATLGTERAQIEAEQAETGRRLAEVSAALAEAREREAGFEAALGVLRGEVEATERADAALAAEIGEARVQVAAVAERVESFARDIARLEELGREAGERIDAAARRRAQLAERRAELTGEVGRADGRARDAVLDRDRLEGQVRETAESHQAQVAERQALEMELRAAEAERQRLVSRIHDLELQATEGRVRREELLQEARRSHGVDGVEALLGAHDPAREPQELRARHEELGEKLEGMGPVNLVADEEYRELEERLGFLRTQYDDLTGSIKDLERALRGMTRTAQERFQEAFDQINRHFGEIFERLFEGGRAELRMVEPEEGDEADPLEQGVELMAQPRGKRLQAVSLMSGGEKALTGLALLFAIFYFRPSPFCVLDEVDAPLDDANIHRFLRVLRELCTQTQFIVITHNRKTMEAADVLYGVTMEEPGLSRLVSVQLTEA
ncbi:MAG TPA: chromosome segregation protein SMC [Methylomirabilota bacterium]|nr:chromosome segregation protein SMC [Methylomirabilota bacterium]